MRINDQKRERVWVGRKFSCDRFKRRGVGHVSALARRDDVAGDAARFSETFAVIGVGSKRARCSHDRGKKRTKAAADLGMAMGAKGAAASAEAADVVLLVDQLDRVLPAIKIARRSRFIALESVYAGLGLSVLGMIAAALGHITPLQGAIFQEVIDIAVILNALRALQDRSV